MNATQKTVIKSTKEMPEWFDINKYSDVQLSLSDWLNQLMVRKWCYLDLENKAAGEKYETHRLESLINNGILSLESNLYLGGLLNSPPIDGRYFIRKLEDISHQHISQCENGDQIASFTGKARFNSMGFNHIMFLAFDADVPNELLLAEFKNFLKEREAIKGKLKRITDADVNRWVKNRVLAYIDLDLWAIHENVEFFDNVLGQSLFPDEYDVVLPERIRKTIKPLALELMELSTLKALEAEAWLEQHASNERHEI